MEFMYLVFTHMRMYLWWSLCILYLHALGCTSGGVYVPCIYTHAGWELPQETRVFVVVLVLRLSVALVNSLVSVTSFDRAS